MLVSLAMSTTPNQRDQYRPQAAELQNLVLHHGQLMPARLSPVWMSAKMEN